MGDYNNDGYLDALIAGACWGFYEANIYKTTGRVVLLILIMARYRNILIPTSKPPGSIMTMTTTWTFLPIIPIYPGYTAMTEAIS